MGGGPFAIFLTRSEGWAAGCTCLKAYQDLHGIRSVSGIVNRWAPSTDNNDTEAYVTRVCVATGFAPDQVIDLHDGPTMLKLVKAMAIEEAGSGVTWPQSEILAGLRLAGLAI